MCIFGKIRKESNPAAMSAASVASVIKPSSLPIWVAATIKGRDVVCNSPAATERRMPKKRAKEQSHREGWEVGAVLAV